MKLPSTSYLRRGAGPPPDPMFGLTGSGANFGASRVTPQGSCSTIKKIGCAAAIAACAASCVVTGPECVACFAAVGASSCIDCL